MSGIIDRTCTLPRHKTLIINYLTLNQTDVFVQKIDLHQYNITVLVGSAKSSSAIFTSF